METETVAAGRLSDPKRNMYEGAEGPVQIRKRRGKSSSQQSGAFRKGEIRERAVSKNGVF